MSKESIEVIKRTEKEALEGKIYEIIAVIKHIEGEEISEEENTKYNLLNIPAGSLPGETLPVDSLKKIRIYLEDSEMQEIIRVNEYMKGNPDEDIFGNFVGTTLPSIRRIINGKEPSQEFIKVIRENTENFLSYLERLSKAKLKAA